MIGRKETPVGTVHKRRRYDLPLNGDAGTGFLLLLVALMTFLVTITLTISFALSTMAARWSSGLESSLTIEIPAQDGDGRILAPDALQPLAARVADLLAADPRIESVRVLGKKEIADLVRPWLGNNAMLDNIPLPALIAVRIREDARPDPVQLERKINAVAPQARLETHETWLQDVLRFTGVLRFAALTMTALIILTTVTAVAGAIRSRMAVHREEINLLHLMGAPDGYIARQFRMHSLFLALKGAAAGTCGGALALWIVSIAAARLAPGLLPGFHTAAWQMLALAALPFVTAGIAAATAHHTVHRTLRRMP